MVIATCISKQQKIFQPEHSNSPPPRQSIPKDTSIILYFQLTLIKQDFKFYVVISMEKSDQVLKGVKYKFDHVWKGPRLGQYDRFQ